MGKPRLSVAWGRGEADKAHDLAMAIRSSEDTALDREEVRVRE